MGKSSYHIFDLFGFPIKLHVSWFIIAVLLGWTLSVGYFPATLPGQSSIVYGLMGFAGAIGLFLSILLHECGHSVMARRYGVPIRGITLFIFGGIAEMEDEPPTPRSEFVVAIAGPIVSLVIAGISYLAASAFALAMSDAAAQVFLYLAWVNFIVTVFNLVPAFPLDGGRVLRAYLWKRRGNLRSATRTGARAGTAFGVFLIVIGLLNVLEGALIAGMWWGLLGLFLQGASRSSLQQVEIRRVLGHEPTSRFMHPDPVTVDAGVPLDRFIEEYVYRYHFKVFPVMRDSHLIGCVGINSVKGFPREQWHSHRVEELTVPCPGSGVVTPETDALETLKLMNRSGQTRLPVVRNGELAGIVSLRDLLGYLSVKLDVEGGAGSSEVRELAHSAQ